MLKRKKKVIAKVMATTMLATTIATTFGIEAKADSISPRTAVSSSKISGSDRYKTAVEISKNYSSSSKHAVIVNGQKGIVDALTATPYASLKNAPILMTQNNKLNADTKAELTRRGIKTVDIVGGVNSVNDSVKSEIQAMGITVNRIAGSSKYDTALEVAKKIDAISDISKIAVANGEVLADAVSVAAPAAQNEMPIILAHPTKGLDDKTKSYINGEGVNTSYVIGGTNSVSNTTQNSLPGTKKRLEGSGRQDTNAAVVKEFYTSSSYDNVYVTKSGQVNTQDEIADALAVGVLAAKEQDPVMIVGKSLANSQANLLADKSFTKVTEIGNGIPTASMESIKNTQNTVKEVTTVSALNSALESAKDGDTINFKPSSTIAENVKLSTSRNVTVNLDGTHSKPVTVDMANATLNINGNISEKVSVDAIKTLKVKSGVTVKHLEIKSGAKNASVTNSGTVTTFDVLATGVKISGSGEITTLNANYDTNFSEFTGKIGNLDKSKPVSQITALNSKEVLVRFSQSLDSEPTVQISKSATQVNNSVELLEGGMSAIVTVNKGDYLDGTYYLDVTNMRSHGTKLDDYRTTIKAEDNTAPQVNSVSFNQNTDEIEISLSEPIDVKAGLVLKLNNQSYESSVAEFTKPTKKIVFKRPREISLGTSNVNVYIAGLKDPAKNLMKSYTGSFNISKENLTVSASQVGNRRIRLKFNKELKNNSLTADDIKVETTSPVNAIGVTDVIKMGELDTTGRTYDVVINDALGSKTSQAIKIKMDAGVCEDNTNIANGKVDISLTLNKDTSNPSISSVSLGKNRASFEVKLSEAIDATSIDKEKIVLKQNTIPVDKTKVNVKLKDETENTLIISTLDNTAIDTETGQFAGGNYQLYFAKDAFNDLSGNGSGSYNSQNIIINETTEDKNLDVKIGNESGKDNYFIITAPLGEKFKSTATLSNKSFSIDGKDIPESSVIEFTNDKDVEGNYTYTKIRIGIEDEFIKSTGSATLKVSGLQLDSGKTTSDTTTTVQVKDNTAPVLEKAELITVKKKGTSEIKRYELRLKFDDFIDVDSEIKDKKDNIDKLLNDIEIRNTASTPVIYKGQSDGLAKDKGTYSTNNDQLIISIDFNDINDRDNWNAVLGTSNSAVLEIKNDVNIIKDKDNTTLLAKKGITKNIIKSSIEEE